MPSRPSLWKHSNAVFERMAAEAEDVPGVGKVWRGFLTQLIISPESTGGLGLPSPYYSHITSVLKQVDAIRQLKRGGGSTPSEWLVLEMPDRELFDWKLDNDRLGAKGTRKATKEEILRQTLDSLTSGMLELRRRVDTLEAHNGPIGSGSLNEGASN